MSASSLLSAQQSLKCHTLRQTTAIYIKEQQQPVHDGRLNESGFSNRKSAKAKVIAVAMKDLSPEERARKARMMLSHAFSQRLQ